MIERKREVIQNVSVKGQRAQVMGFGGHPVSDETAQLCRCSREAGPDNMPANEPAGASTKLWLQNS